MISSRYKRADGRTVRHGLVEALLAATARWLRVPPDVCEQCRDSDHVLDALVASLVARACAIDLCEPMPDEDRAIAAREGWIALPRPDTLAILAGV
jgi:hypothetical protein